MTVLTLSLCFKLSKLQLKIVLHHWQMQDKFIEYVYTTVILSLTHLHFILKISWAPTKAITDKISEAKRVLSVSTIITCIARIMSSQMCHIFAWEIKPICGNGGLGLREYRVACKDEWYLAQHEENERCAARCLAQMKALISGAKIKMTERWRLQLGPLLLISLSSRLILEQ